MTQAEMILLHLKRHRTITPGHAWTKYGVYRLADVVHKLRRRGQEIATETMRKGKTTYAKYRLMA